MKMISLFLWPLLAATITCQAQSAAPAAPAATPEPAPSPFTANISLTTKYKFRGQDQGNTNWFSPALQGGFDWTRDGWYVGNWNSNVSFSNAAIEMDFYGGYRGEITKDLTYDVGILEYYYPQRDKVVNFNTTELYGALSYSFFTLKYSHTVSTDYFGIGQAQSQAGSLNSRPKGRNTGYLDLGANYPLADKLTLNGHLGYTRYASDLRNAATATDSLGVPNYLDYKLGVTYDLGSGFSAAGALVGANKQSFYGDINKARVIFTISKSM